MMLNMTVPERIQSLMAQKGLTQSALADVVGLSKSVVSQHLSGARGIKADKLSLYAKALDTTEADLLGINVVDRATSTKLPYWGLVPAGDWERPESDIELISVPGDHKRSIAVRVQGLSMFPKIRPNSLVVIKLDDTQKDGVISLAKNAEQELTLKITRMKQGKWTLEPINPEYPAVTADQWEILGYATMIIDEDPLGIIP